MAERTRRVEEIMTGFGERTGLTSDRPPRRYLWTDAFAVCNYLALYRRTGAVRWREEAQSLVHQVHHVLGRHRPDDERTGWISGLSEVEGEAHPTVGGLRIGKPLPERGPDEPFDDDLEWERDGQYYHYLTRWTHALARLGRELDDPEPLRYATELARSAHAAFVHPAPGLPGGRGLAWKMSIDLSRPLVPSMGHHDPLEGLAVAVELDAARPGLEPEIGELAEMCRGRSWTTADALGIGGLLGAAWLLAHADRPVLRRLLDRVLDDAARSLDLVATGRYLAGPASSRLAFRELGLSLGLAATERLHEEVARKATRETAAVGDGVRHLLDRIAPHFALRHRVEEFWLEGPHRAVPTWTEHEDINAVMLATCLAPEGYLGISNGVGVPLA